MMRVSSTYLSYNLGGVGGSIDNLGFKHFHEQVGHNGADGGSHGCPMHLFTKLNLEEEIGVLRQNFNSVMISCIDLGCPKV